MNTPKKCNCNPNLKGNTMTHITDTIAEIERELLRIEKTPESYVGGLKAFYSGYQVFYKPAVQRKVDKLKRRLYALYDQCEA